MGKIFISYRRADSQDIADRIYEKLANRYGKANVFKDVDSIPFGRDFREHVKTSIDQSNVMLVIIGKNWLNLLRERKGEDLDFVLIEILSALNKKEEMSIVPVLVNNTKMPKVKDLPEELKDFKFLNAALVRPDPDFSHDMRRLQDILDLEIKPARVTKYLVATLAVVAIAVAVGIGVWSRGQTPDYLNVCYAKKYVVDTNKMVYAGCKIETKDCAHLGLMEFGKNYSAGDEVKSALQRCRNGAPRGIKKSEPPSALSPVVNPEPASVNFPMKYDARLSPQDHVNSRGVRLEGVADILRQGRGQTPDYLNVCYAKKDVVDTNKVEYKGCKIETKDCTHLGLMEFGKNYSAGDEAESALQRCINGAPRGIKKSEPPSALSPVVNPEPASVNFPMKYDARLSPQDHVNSRGVHLESVADILRQDRANFHKLHKKDPEDTSANFFNTEAHRNQIETMVAHHPLPEDTVNAILKGTPLVHVAIYPERLDVNVIKQGQALAQTTRSKIRDFLLRYYKMGESNVPENELTYYAPRIEDYFGRGTISQDVILREQLAYAKKFPKRSYELVSLESIKEIPQNGTTEYIVHPTLRWRTVDTDGHSKSGTTKQRVKLIRVGESFQIKGIRGKGVR